MYFIQVFSRVVENFVSLSNCEKKKKKKKMIECISQELMKKNGQKLDITKRTLFVYLFIHFLDPNLFIK